MRQLLLAICPLIKSRKNIIVLDEINDKQLDEMADGSVDDSMLLEGDVRGAFMTASFLSE